MCGNHALLSRYNADEFDGWTSRPLAIRCPAGRLVARVSGRREGEDAYDGLLHIGPSVVEPLAAIVADAASPFREAAVTLIECFHPVIVSSAALSSLRAAIREDDPWLRLWCAEAVWCIEGETGEVRGIVEELATFAEVELRRKAMNVLDTFARRL